MKDKLRDFLKAAAKIEKGKRLVIGIDGLSRSGKTTIVKEVKQFFENSNITVRIFHIDDYIVERSKRYDTGHEEWYEYYQLQWDVNQLKQQLFDRLKTADELHLPKYEDSTDSIVEEVVLVPDTIVNIVEGVFIQRDEWRGCFDFVIYLDCSREKRFSRESIETQRKIEKFKNRYWKAEDYYLENVSPMKLADLVIDNE